MGYTEDRLWADSFNRQVMKICKKSLKSKGIKASNPSDDSFRATDLYTTEGITIAVRIRKDGFIDKYADEFTVRVGRPKTGEDQGELRKIKRGFGDYMLYGFTKDKKVVHWTLIDLQKFREYLDSDEYEVPVKIPNKDDSSWFSPFKIQEEWIVDKSW